jgi:allantoate deiminase
MDTSQTRTRAETVIDRCRRLASFTEVSGTICRTFLSPSIERCHEGLARWLAPLKAEPQVDAAGNFRALYAGAQPDSPRLLMGSHLDTVPNAGAYDGLLGVVLAGTLLEELHGRRFPFAIEVIGFSEEEGVRFGTPFIGSRALVGRLDQDLLNAKDMNGISVQEAIGCFGLKPEEIGQAELQNDALAYLEFHIEQGPVLERLNQPLAAVQAIAGHSRMEFTFKGQSNHAGTTPMHLRHDALAGAAEWISVVERIAKTVPGLVATVGKLEAQPGAANVIAGEVRMTLDVRHAVDEVRIHATGDILRAAREIASHRGLSVHESTLHNQPAVAMDEFLTAEIEKAIAKTGCSSNRMVSGAGHDAMILAEKIPTGMIFLRTPGGISHDPAETVLVEDVEKAISSGLHLLEQLSDSPEFLKRTNRA